MSVVGPRPERPEILRDLAMAIPLFEERMRGVKPGITGLAQVNLGYAGKPMEGSAVADFNDDLTNPFDLEEADGALADEMRMKLLYDLAYVAGLEKFWTFITTELAIIVKTPWAMVAGIGR
jgi:lipopolysaccharide/colanic/teichoic acid biosynthesis glycosyltransferase